MKRGGARSKKSRLHASLLVINLSKAKRLIVIIVALKQYLYFQIWLSAGEDSLTSLSVRLPHGVFLDWGTYFDWGTWIAPSQK
jgi:hypothetical protein